MAYYNFHCVITGVEFILQTNSFNPHYSYVLSLPELRCQILLPYLYTGRDLQR